MLSAASTVPAVVVFSKDLVHICCLCFAACASLASSSAGLGHESVTAVHLLQTTCVDGVQVARVQSKVQDPLCTYTLLTMTALQLSALQHNCSLTSKIHCSCPALARWSCTCLFRQPC